MAAELIHSDGISPDFVPVQRDSLASVEIDGEGLVFDEDLGAWHFLNPMAQVIWRCCDGSGSLDEIARDIAEIYEEDYDTVLEGVMDAVLQFGRQGLLRGVERIEQTGHHAHDHNHGAEDGPEDGEAPRFIPVPPSS